jgi:hypothetical protein
MATPYTATDGSWHGSQYATWQRGQYIDGTDIDILTDLTSDLSFAPHPPTPRTPVFPQYGTEENYPESYSDSESNYTVTTSVTAPSQASAMSSMPADAGHGQQVGQETYMSSIAMPCEFADVLGCNATFDSVEGVDEWVHHHLDHLNITETRKLPSTRCTRCGTPEKFTEFWDRMHHIRQHWVEGTATRRFPDMHLLEYMVRKGIIGGEDLEEERQRLPVWPGRTRTVRDRSSQVPAPLEKEERQRKRETEGKKHHHHKHRHGQRK